MDTTQTGRVGFRDNVIKGSPPEVFPDGVAQQSALRPSRYSVNTPPLVTPATHSVSSPAPGIDTGDKGEGHEDEDGFEVDIEEGNTAETKVTSVKRHTRPVRDNSSEESYMTVHIKAVAGTKQVERLHEGWYGLIEACLRLDSTCSFMCIYNDPSITPMSTDRLSSQVTRQRGGWTKIFYVR